MLRRLALAVAFLVVLAAVGRAQDPHRPQPSPATPAVAADDIVARTIAALHLDKLKSVQTRRLTGVMSVVPPGIEAPIVIESKRPSKLRVTITIEGHENIEAYDGESAWALAPAQGKSAPEPVPDEEMKLMRAQADFDGEFVDYKAKGTTVEVQGKEAVEGTDAWKLKVTLKDGTEMYEYIDAQQYLPIKLEINRTINGAPTKTETFLGDYKDEGGLMVPHSSSTKLNVQGTTLTQKVVIQKVEMNVPIEDVRFKMPAAK